MLVIREFEIFPQFHPLFYSTWRVDKRTEGYVLNILEVSDPQSWKLRSIHFVSINFLSYVYIGYIKSINIFFKFFVSQNYPESLNFSKLKQVKLGEIGLRCRAKPDYLRLGQILLY